MNTLPIAASQPPQPSPARDEVLRVLATLADAGEPLHVAYKTASVLATLEIRPLAAIGFVPRALQQDILAALDGRAMRTDALANKCDVDRSTIFRKGGLKELRELRLVDHHPSVGFFRPDAPPPEMRAPQGETS